MNEKNLPGFISVGYCKSSNLQPDVLDIYDEDDRMKIYGSLINIPIVGIGSMTVSSEEKKGATVYNLISSFQICGDDEAAKKICSVLSENIHAFIFETVDRNKMLVGTHEKPFPTVMWQYMNESSPTGKRGYFIEVAYQNTHSAILLE
ncbi:MAG: hypothetical protein PHQ11_16930 [Paludibacter sp.]|nr:hypothetical protein [Paludibacter sp.]MDD4429175.1 hypothetical protein [Paludibacter sp.]